MVLDYLGVTVEEKRLRQRLGTTAEGTPFPHITRLQALGLFLQYDKNGDLSIFERFLASGLPVIVGVKTLAWQHWGGEVTPPCRGRRGHRSGKQPDLYSRSIFCR